MSRRHIIHSPRLEELKRRRRNAFTLKSFLLLLVVGGIIAGLTAISRWERINIIKIEVVGNKIADASLITESARTSMEGKYLWLFPKTNIFFYPKDKIKDALDKDFMRLTDITLQIRPEQVLEISVAERVSVYTWCGEEPPVTSTSEEVCYFMDKDGFIFEEAPYISGEVYFKFYGGIPVDENGPVGKRYSLSMWESLHYFKELLLGIGVEPVAFFVENSIDAKAFLSTKDVRSDNPEIFFKLNSDFEKIAENLETALNTEPFMAEFKKKYAVLAYIDLRFGSKVYYRFK